MGNNRTMHYALCLASSTSDYGGIYGTWDHTLVARSRGYVMWEELSVSLFYNIVTIGNGTKNDFQGKRVLPVS